MQRGESGPRPEPEIVVPSAETAVGDDAQSSAGVSGVPLEPTSEAIKRLEAERDELRDRYLRLAADFDNFRKRAAKERLELADRSQAGLAIKLLDVLDDLDRLVAGDQAAASGPIHQAMVLIDKKLRKELDAAGLERLDPVGAPFDPTLHEAVATAPTTNPALDHTVSATFQAGYRFKGSLIRPARVQVYSAEGHA